MKSFRADADRRRWTRQGRTVTITTRESASAQRHIAERHARWVEEVRLSRERKRDAYKGLSDKIGGREWGTLSATKADLTPWHRRTATPTNQKVRIALKTSRYISQPTCLEKVIDLRNGRWMECGARTKHLLGPASNTSWERVSRPFGLGPWRH